MGVLKIILYALLLFQATKVHTLKNDCPSLTCGHNPFVVHFPFRLQGQQSQSCGYPGFDLACTGYQNSTAILNLPKSGDFFVRHINYFQQEIQLFDLNNCLPKRVLSLNLSTTPFTCRHSRDYTLLSCPPESIASTPFTTIDCLSNSTESVVAVLSTDFVRPLNTCSVIATLSAPLSWQLNNGLNEDILLTWNVPDCGGCEAKGGVCGFENSTSDRIMCFPDSGTDNSQGIKIFKIIALCIVVPTLTCSLAISCYAFIVGRRAAWHLAAIGPPPQLAAASGLDESTIESYTKVVLGESLRLAGPNGATCPMWLVDYRPKDMLRCMPPCEHCFHSDCVDEWLRLNGSCPLCRSSPLPARADA